MPDLLCCTLSSGKNPHRCGVVECVKNFVNLKSIMCPACSRNSIDAEADDFV